ncbi:TRAP transporter substrate-binding protein [Lyngbya sp. CCY1209]|uniref:TRAP transporter substrate-binding protein n=1 Tax=Lyngbya sp. CCY1209 TaxID=2886103 RepID=UPI002D20E49C|nr:TRAP transporter substrate-binding protein [Lyngbya sp. CCY1209]MEB3882857.1 TRAP transporter substrate-binding protein [Lyngbya sp. CCY1209]
MKRRNFIGTAAIATAGTATFGACSPRPQPPEETTPRVSTAEPAIRWRMATSWPKSLDIVFGSSDLICRRVAAMTGGKFTIVPYGAGEIVPGLEVMKAVQAETVECGHTASYYYVNEHPALAFATTVPFGLNAEQQFAWLYYGGGLEAIRDIYADFNLINFPAGNTGAQMGGWFRRQVNSPDDLKGLKMRIPGLGGKVMSRLGVDVQVLAGGEIFPALERGDIDAAEWVGPYEDERLGLNRVAPYYYSPGWWEPGTTYELQVNRRQWEILPREYQEILQLATAEATTRMLAQYNTANGEALERMAAGGTQLLSYSESILNAARDAAFALYEEKARGNEAFREIYDRWAAFRTKVYRWHRVNGFSFDRFAFREVR